MEIKSFQPIYTPEQRQKIITKETKYLKKIYSDFGMDEDRMKLAIKLIEEAAFLKFALMESKEIIKRDGTVELYKNGAEQFGQKKSSAMENYKNTIKSYSDVIKQLETMLPNSDDKNSAAKELLEAISK